MAPGFIGPEAADVLRKEEVDGEVLRSLTESDMRQLGLSFGASRKLLLRLKEVTSEQKPSHPPSRPSPPVASEPSPVKRSIDDWHSPRKRPRLGMEALSQLEHAPAIPENAPQTQLVSAKLRVDRKLAEKVTKAYTAPKKEKVAKGRGFEDIQKDVPHWFGAIEGTAEEDELEASLGTRHESFTFSLQDVKPKLFEWQHCPSMPSISGVRDFKEAMEAAAGINAVKVTKSISMGTQKMHQAVLATRKSWFDPNAQYMNASPKEFKWKSKPRYACRKCLDRKCGGFYYNHVDATGSGGPFHSHQSMFGHYPDLVSWLNQHALSYDHKDHEERNQYETTAMTMMMTSSEIIK